MNRKINKQKKVTVALSRTKEEPRKEAQATLRTGHCKYNRKAVPHKRQTYNTKILSIFNRI